MIKNGKYAIINFLKIGLFVLIGGNISFSYAQDCEKIDDAFQRYQCFSQQICNAEPYIENKKVFNPEKFKTADNYKETETTDVFLKSARDEKPIKKAVSVYKENMNSIYKCAMIGIQKNSILNVKGLLKLEKTGELGKALGVKIDTIINKLDMTSNASKCLEIDKKTTSNKLSILKQTSQVTCDYAFYIDYLKQYYKDPKNALGLDKKDIEEGKEYLTTEVGKKLNSIQQDLDNELQHSLKIFPIAFHAYSEYENNYPIHFLLDLVKEDYMIFRDKLYEVTNPINQVVYKISNAMKK